MGFDSISSGSAWGSQGSSLFDRFPLGGAKIWKNYALVHRVMAEARAAGSLSPERAKNFQNAEALLGRMESRSLVELVMPVQYSSLASLALGRYA